MCVGAHSADVGRQRGDVGLGGDVLTARRAERGDDSFGQPIVCARILDRFTDACVLKTRDGMMCCMIPPPSDGGSVARTLYKTRLGPEDCKTVRLRTLSGGGSQSVRDAHVVVSRTTHSATAAPTSRDSASSDSPRRFDHSNPLYR